MARPVETPLPWPSCSSRRTRALSLAHVHELTPVRGASGAYGVAEHDASMRLLEQEREATGVEAELITVTASSAGRGLHYLAETNDADLLARRLERAQLRRTSPGGRHHPRRDDRRALRRRGRAAGVFAARPAAIATIGVGYDGSPRARRRWRSRASSPPITARN